MMKAAVIGCGWAALQHLKGYQKLDNVNIVALCARKPEKLHSITGDFGISGKYNDYRQMLEIEKPDLVSVCTPNCYHAEMSIDAMNAGANVICEKPMAVSSVDAEKMYKVSKATGKVLFVAHQRRFESGSVYLKKLIDDGSLGDIYHVNAKWIRRQGIPGMGGWFTNKALSGGGALIDIGVHVLDLAMWFMGFPLVQSVTSSYGSRFGINGNGAGEYGIRGRSGANVFDVEDYAFAHIRFSEGRSMQLQCSWAANIKSDAVNIELWGEKSGASLYPLEIYSSSDGKLTDSSPDIAQNNPFDEQIRAFSESAASGINCVYNPQDGIRVMELVEEIYRNGNAAS